MATRTDVDLLGLIRSAKRSVYRIEQQPVYDAAVTAYRLDLWQAGNPIDPTTVDEFADWLQLVATVTAKGIQVARVRIDQDPPTDYQQMSRWIGRWNTAVGEQLHYTDQTTAARTGVQAKLGPADWWLIDEETVVLFEFDGAGVFQSIGATTDPTVVAPLVKVWREALNISKVDASTP